MRYEQMFAGHRDGVLIPFLMLGDPSPDASLDAADALVAGGADALELGIPYSDPVADGPVIQCAASRALAAGVTPARCMELIAAIRAAHPRLPIGLLVYANLVVRRGVPGFYRSAAAAGADSVLVADVPGREARPFADAARAAGIHPVFMVPPAARAEVIARAAAWGGGYTYVQGRPGVTGAATPMAPPDRALIAALAAAGAPPAIIGFGISRRTHLDAALAAGARGVIVGSAVVQVIERFADDGERMRAELVRLMTGVRDQGSRTPAPARSDAAAGPP